MTLDHEEVLYYSVKQAALAKHAGVVLVDGESKPVLWTETVSNSRMHRDDFNRRGMREPETPSLKSNWDDAVFIFSGKGDGRGYQRLLDGMGEVTAEGQKWCASQGIAPTPQALLAVAEPPSGRLRVMKPFHLRGK